MKDNKNIDFSSEGMLPNAELRFMRIYSDGKNISLTNVRQFAEDENYVDKNTVCITQDNCPLEIKAIRLMKSSK